MTVIWNLYLASGMMAINEKMELDM